MTAHIRAWTSATGAILLHPDFTTNKKHTQPIGIALKDGVQCGGIGVWPVLSFGSTTTASQIPSEWFASSGPVSAKSLALAPTCQLKTLPRPLSPHPVPVSTDDVAATLDSEQNVYDALAAQYWQVLAVKNAVKEAIETASANSRRFINACAVARRVADPELWELLAARARLSDNVAEASLRHLPDPRGVDFFAAALGAEANPPLGRPLLVNALLFFICCCTDHGLGYLSNVLGDPFTSRADSKAARMARVMIGMVLEDAHFDYDLEVNEGWREYVCAALLAERILSDEIWMVTKALRLLRRHRDPRTPLVMWRLIRENRYDDSDVVPSLTVVRGDDSIRATKSLLAETRASRARPSGATSVRLQELESMLMDVAQKLGIEA